MPRIQVNRDTVDDRFSVLGFTVRSESPLFEVGVATDPELFRAENRGRRARSNFYSSRAVGAIRARRGEAVYLLPPEVLANFVGQPRLYFGLATYREGSTSAPDFVQTPSAGNMYVNIAGLTERGLRRFAAQAATPSYGRANGADPSLDWGGDARPQPAVPPAANGSAARGGNGRPNGAAAPAPAVPYDDGFGAFPKPKAPAEAPAPQAGSPSSPPAPAPAPVAAQALGRIRRAVPALEAADEERGIEGPIPDAAGPVSEGQAARALGGPSPEYPQASRFAPANAGNYRSVSGTRSIDRIVIHITDGGAGINGPISWFQNPSAGVSAHYVIGRDGEVVQMVAHKDVAWHARSANGTSIGIEHVANTRGLNPTVAQMEASAALVTWLCDQYGIPADRDHIQGHSEADPRTTHTGCPNAVWEWDYYMQMVTSRMCIEPPPGSRVQAQSLARAMARPPLARPAPARAASIFGVRRLARAQEILPQFYDPSDPGTALQCQADAFSVEREEWFAGVPNTRIFPHSAICKIITTDAAGVRRGATGFYIGRNRVLTAGHVLHNKVSADIVPGKNGSEEPFGRCTVTSASWRKSNRYPADGSDYDLGVIDNVAIAAPGGRWFEFLMATPGPNMPVVVCGYAAQSVTVPELTQAIDPNMQHLHGGYVETAAAETFDYPILTLKGNSGSPVYHLREEGGELKALVAGVHVSGEPAARGLNRGCFITPDKIDWIEGRTSALAYAPGEPAQALRPPYVRRIAARARSLGSVGGRALGLTDLLPVDLKLRVFIPSPAILMEIGPDRAFGADGRSFQRDGGTSRAEVLARFHFDGGNGRPRLEILDRHWGESTEYRVSDTQPVAGKPSWYRSKSPGAQPTARETLRVSDDNLNATLGGDLVSGIASVVEGSVIVSFNVAGGLPLVRLAPDVDAHLRVHLKVENGRVFARVRGTHDEFPAYEVYANDQLLYSYDPVASGGTPVGLLGTGDFDVELDTDWVDCGPASEFRIIGPVRIGGSAQALEVPLDPGVGGQSIGPDALLPADIIVSTTRHPVSYAIRAGTISQVSHAMLYAGDGKVIEAVGEGVREIPLAQAIDDAILAVAYRDPRVDAATAHSIVDFARAQVGRPYNYAGVAATGYRMLHPLPGRLVDALRDRLGVDRTTASTFYCSQLVAAAYEAAGAQLIPARPDASTADDIVQLAQGRLQYVGHLRGEDTLLGIALAYQQDNGRGAGAAALGNEAIEHEVQLIPQPNKTSCWAAAMAMLLSARGSQSIGPEAIVNAVGETLMSSYGWDLLTRVRDHYGFQFIDLPSNTSFYFQPGQWAAWLRELGPLWVVIVGMPHAVVVSGIRGDLNNPASVQVRVLNPWDTRVTFDDDPVEFRPRNEGYADWLPFEQFARDFGTMAEPNYGNWRVLHLPFNAATAQALGAGVATRRPQPASGRSRRAAPPARTRALAEEPAGDTSQAPTPPTPPTPPAPPAAEPIEPSRVPGTVMRRVSGSRGRVRWALDQLEGLKHPAPATMAMDALVPTVIQIDTWPLIGTDPMPLPLTLSFDAGGGSLGNVRIEAGSAGEVPCDVSVTATIEDDNKPVAIDTGTLAALRVTIDYRFSGTPEGEQTGRVSLRLLGNGRFDQDNFWL
jgi:V8-like Glu-specific endopeptidase/N-acetyl-anhydromuramyl-L-alanine amidase AmpD/cell wall-associated NlpC family hydrolase